MFLEFLADRTTHYLDRQYMLGPNLLVAPVFVPEGEESEYYLPAGRWTSFFHSERTVDGPTWVKEIVPIDEIPVWVRPGSVLCLGPEGVGRPDYEFAKMVEVRAYELAEGQTVKAEVPTGKGNDIAGTVEVEKVGEKVFVKVSEGSIGLTSVSAFVQGKETKQQVEGGNVQVELHL
jgi:alpha-glucosidase (family GH31 glycosyl hydrolase)